MGTLAFHFIPAPLGFCSYYELDMGAFWVHSLAMGCWMAYSLAEERGEASRSGCRSMHSGNFWQILQSQPNVMTRNGSHGYICGDFFPITAFSFFYQFSTYT